MIPVSYNLRSLGVRRLSSATTAAGFALVVFVLSSVVMLSNGLHSTVTRTVSPDQVIVLHTGSVAESASLFAATKGRDVIQSPEIAKSAEGPRAVAELVSSALLPKVGAGGVANVMVRGVGPSSMAFRPRLRVTQGRDARSGVDEVIVGRALVGRFKGLEIGQSFNLGRSRRVTVVGVFSDDGSSCESEIWIDLDTLRSAIGRPALVSSVRVHLANPSDLPSFKARVSQDSRLELEAVRESDYADRMTEGAQGVLDAIGYLMVIFLSLAAVIAAVNSMYTAIANRTPEIGVLRAIGFGRGSILVSFLLEGTLLSVVGSGVGCLAALAMTFVKVSAVNPASGLELVIGFEPTIAILTRAVAVTVAMGLVGAIAPALRASRVSPLVAIRG